MDEWTPQLVLPACTFQSRIFREKIRQKMNNIETLYSRFGGLSVLPILKFYDLIMFFFGFNFLANFSSAFSGFFLV